MEIIDLKIEEIKNNYKTKTPLFIQGVKYSIGLICGAIQEFRLYSKGKEYIVYSDYKKEQETTFIIIT